LDSITVEDWGEEIFVEGVVVVGGRGRKLILFHPYPRRVGAEAG